MGGLNLLHLKSCFVPNAEYTIHTFILFIYTYVPLRYHDALFKWNHGGACVTKRAILLHCILNSHS